MINLADIDETCLDRFRPGYADLFISHFAQEFGWTKEFTRVVTRNAVQFLAVCAMPLNSAETDTSFEARTMVSSPVVDKIVDAIMLDRPLLLWLEHSVLHARMIHVPAYAHGTDSVLMNVRYEFTIALMQAAGYKVDPAIWPDRLPKDYATCGCSNDLEDCKMYAQPLE